MPRHGFRYHPLYNTHHNMMRRCYDEANPAFHDYGGRGIAVCNRWHNVATFVNDNATKYRRGLTLDRIDNDAGYSPDNCRWISRSAQNRNRRSVINVTYRGETLPLHAWAKRLKMRRETLWMRIVERGWTAERAIETPLKKSSPR